MKLRKLEFGVPIRFKNLVKLQKLEFGVPIEKRRKRKISINCQFVGIAKTSISRGPKIDRFRLKSGPDNVGFQSIFQSKTDPFAINN